MSCSEIPVGSFSYLTVGKTDILVKWLEVALFDPNTVDVGIHSYVSERYARKVISNFNFPTGTEVVISRCRNMASLCPIGFSAAYVE